MKYYLVLEKKNKVLKPIKWNSITGYGDDDLNDLHDICNFTMDFNNLENLKEVLLYMGFISIEEYNERNNLAIIYTYRKENRKLMYGVSYSGDSKFFDIEYLKNYLLSKRNDVNLMTKLCNHYRNNPLVLGNIASIRNYINNLKNGVNCYDISEEIINFIAKIVYKYDYKNNCYLKSTDGYLVENTRPLRDLAMFLSYDYHNNVKRNSLLEAQKTLEVIKNTKTVKHQRTKVLDGQISIFDII